MLIVFGVLSELTYLFLFIKAHDLGLLNLHENQHLAWVIVCLLILFFAYFYCYFFLNWSRTTTKKIFIVIFIFHLTFLFVPYLSSNDLYSYIFVTRISGIYHQNPYFINYNHFPQDPLYPQLHNIWSEQTTLYGPLFLLLGSLINIIGQNNLLFLTLVFKSLFITSNLVSIWLIYKITQSKQAVFLFGASPLIIFELSGNSHTETLTCLFLLIIFYYYKKPVVSFLGLVLSALIKYSPLVLLPLILIRLKQAGFKAFITSLILGLLLTSLLYYPFWRGPENFDYLGAYYNGQYASHSLLIYPFELFFSYARAFKINTAIFLLITLVLTYKFWLAKAELRVFIFYSFLLYTAYLLTKLSLILTWYLTPLVLLASLLVTWKQYQKYAYLALVCTSIYSLLIYYFVR